MRITLEPEETADILKQEFQRQFPEKKVSVYHENDGIFVIAVD